LSKVEDKELVMNVLSARPGAFAQLVHQHQKLVWHLIYRMVQHPEDTRELSQEVFMLVHQKLHQFRYESALSSWIGRIAFNIASRYLKKASKWQFQNTSNNRESGEQSNDTADPITSLCDQADLSRDLAELQMYQKVEQLMQQLPPVSRTVVSLYHLDELSVPEIAQITDIPAGTIKSHLFRARRELRHKLNKELIGNNDNQD